MSQTAWKDFLAVLEKTYYTQIIVVIVSIFLLFVILRNFPKKKFAHLFLIYTFSCLILFVGLPIQLLFFPVEGRLTTAIREVANTLFAISELCVFVVFFFQIINSKNSKILLLLFIGAFLMSIAAFGVKVFDLTNGKSEIMKASVVVNIIEFSIFLIALLSYFIELFLRPPTKDLGRSSAFWISSGLFIYILASLPLLMFGEYIWLDGKNLYFFLFSLHLLSLSLLLLTISKAFLCQEPLTS